jgi:hypothetical protein
MLDEITLKDIYEKQIRCELMLIEVMNRLNADKTDVIMEEKNTVESESPFLDPNTGLFSYQYYLRTHTKEGE